MQHGLALRRRSSSISLLAGEVGENGAYTWQRALTCTMKDASTQSSNEHTIKQPAISRAQLTNSNLASTAASKGDVGEAGDVGAATGDVGT